MMPMWDKAFSYGHGFPDQIKTFIAHAHVFLPVITEASSRHGGDIRHGRARATR